MWMLALVLMTACWPKNPFPEDSLPAWEERPVTGTFKESPSDVWDAAITVMGQAAPLETMDSDRGLIQTRWVRDHSDYLYKTYGGTRIPEPVRWRMTVRVRKEGSSTEVEIVSQEQVEKDLVSANLEFTGSVYKWVDVPSSTSREQLFLEKILTEIENADSDDDYDYDYAR
ncbi:MAG: hypothetical protein VX899_07280 [Myxococcota bacterium]|nr:hypothetical protein [Myxococcota bacterium]